MSPLVAAARAFVYVGWVEQRSYPLAMLDRAFAAIAVLAMLFFGGRFIDSQGIDGLDTGYFLYGVAGFATMQIFIGTTTGFRNKIRNFQLHGVLEACAMTRTPFATFLVAAPSYDLAASFSIALAAIVGAHAFFGAPVSAPRAALALGFLVVGSIGFVALGLVSGAMSLALKKGDPLNRAMTLATLLFGGAYYPRTVLPPAIQPLADWLPIAPVVDGIRASLYGSLDAAVLGPAFARAAVIAVGSLLAAAVAVRWSVRVAQRDGSLGHY